MSAAEIDIRPSATQMLRDLGHPAAEGEPLYDVTYENVQAGERTSHLFRLANLHHALVLGTGDLQRAGARLEHLRRRRPHVALQRQRLGAQDADPVPDPLGDRHRPVRRRGQRGAELGPRHRDLARAGAPRPTSDGDGPGQNSESTVGPYELQDFFLYYILRFGYRPSKVAFLAHHAWGDRDARRLAGPDPAWSAATSTRWPRSRHWLEVFLYRFFQTSQFKRSAIPNAPKVGSGGSLSPRGDWRAPSDSHAACVAPGAARARAARGVIRTSAGRIRARPAVRSARGHLPVAPDRRRNHQRRQQQAPRQRRDRGPASAHELW